MGECGGVWVAWTSPAWPSSRGQGPGSAPARGWRRLGCSPFSKKPPDKDTDTRWCQELEENSGRTRQGHRDAEGPATSETTRGRQGPGCSPRAEKGGANKHGNGSRRSHTVLSAGTSSRGWRAGAWRATSRWVALHTSKVGGERV